MALKMIKIILICLGVVLLIWFLLPFFTHRILNIGNVTGIIVSLVLLLYGIFFRQVNGLLGAFWQHGIGKVIEIIVGVCILAILVLAAMTMISMADGMRQTAEPASGGPKVEINGHVISQENVFGSGAVSGEKTVIVLGCKALGDRPSLMLEERLQAALSYLKEHPSANAIVSGGQGKDEIMPEAEVMYNWLIENGISKERLIKEERSTDTHENLQYCYDILAELDNNGGEPSGWSREVVIVTNEFHEYRAVKIARALGFRAQPLPAATAWWLFPTYYVREMYGILEDWFLV